jgi:hypothetical protein
MIRRRGEKNREERMLRNDESCGLANNTSTPGKSTEGLVASAPETLYHPLMAAVATALDASRAGWNELVHGDLLFGKVVIVGEIRCTGGSLLVSIPPTEAIGVPRSSSLYAINASTRYAGNDKDQIEHPNYDRHRHCGVVVRQQQMSIANRVNEVQLWSRAFLNGTTKVREMRRGANEAPVSDTSHHHAVGRPFRDIRIPVRAAKHMMFFRA